MKPGKYNDNDPYQFRMYRELSEKERKQLGEKIKRLDIQCDTLIDNRMKLLKALKLIYRKHVCDDQNVSWGEVSQCLLDTLCEVMGDKAYQEWSESERRRYETNAEVKK